MSITTNYKVKCFCGAQVEVYVTESGNLLYCSHNTPGGNHCAASKKVYKAAAIVSMEIQSWPEQIRKQERELEQD